MSLINHKNTMNDTYSRKPVIIPYYSLKKGLLMQEWPCHSVTRGVFFTHTNYIKNIYTKEISGSE